MLEGINVKLANYFSSILPQGVRDTIMRDQGYTPSNTSEQGTTVKPEDRMRDLRLMMYTDPVLRASIIDIRHMDRIDPRVKKIHKRMGSTTIKGGLILKKEMNTTIQRRWKDFVKRLRLDRREKLESDARGLVMEGNLPLQWVLDKNNRVIAGKRMPTETIVPKVGDNGQFKDPQKAYEQYDNLQGKPIAVFPLWQLSLVRLSPDNYDDLGSFGRPYLDATRSAWKKLVMTEEDMVIRRRERAPMRTSHVLEGATGDEVKDYKKETEDNQKEITTNYYSNKKGGVTPVQGDANLDQIADVVHLLDTFFSGAPAPKGLFGYAGELKRDILEDLKRDYYEEIDSLQDTLAYAYELGFRLDLLLAGINPDDYDFEVAFAERRTETANQAADRALKYDAIGLSKQTVLETAGVDASEEKKRLEKEYKEKDPYPGMGDEDEDPDLDKKKARVKITPGNEPKKESGTSISNK